MTRFTWVAASVLLATGGTAIAGQAEIAAKLNEDGKAALFANDNATASAKFRDAVARAPEPKYFVNLCTSLTLEGKFDEAYTACIAVGQNNPTPEQKDKADKLVAKIKEEVKAQGLELHMGGGGGGATNVTPPPDGGGGGGGGTAPPPDPNGGGGGGTAPPPDPNGGGGGGNAMPPPNGGGPPPNGADYKPTVGRPPAEGAALFLGSKPDNHYTWTLGGDLFGGAGQMGQAGYYGTAMAGVRVKADYMLMPAQRIGVQGYIQYSHFGQGSNDSLNVQSLEDVDFGVAAYKHLCLSMAENICLTPLLGVHLSTMSPQDQTTTNSDGSTTSVFNYVAVGARAEVNLAVAFGRRQEHVLNVALGANMYSKALGYPSDDPNGMLEGLDAGGVIGYLGVGYTYRFNTPFGVMPLVTLE